MKTCENDLLVNIYQKYPLEVKRAKGMYLYTKQGKYLDLFSSLGVNALGHRNKKVIKAIKRKLKENLHLSNYFNSKEAQKLANLLVTSSFPAKVFYTNSGTESNEAALKWVRAYGKATNKAEIISLIDSFHGRTFGAMSLTGQPLKSTKFKPLLDGIKHIKRNDLAVLKESINENTSAVFIELIQGEGGVNPLSKEYVVELIKLREKYKFLIVVDEVQTGLLRTGLLFCYMHYKFTPDIITLAKSIGGGIPLGAVLVSNNLCNLLSTGDHGTTFGGNPVSCAAGYVVLKELTKFKYYHHVNLMSVYLFYKLNNLKDKYPNIIKDVRGKGLMIGIEIEKHSLLIKEEFFKSKILINITNHHIIRLLPALIIKKKQIDLFISELDRILVYLRGLKC